MVAPAYDKMVKEEETLASQLEVYKYPEPFGEKIFTTAQQEFSPVDSSVVRALMSDIDYTDPVEVGNIRQTLAVLMEDAVTQEANTSFDPSGMSGPVQQGSRGRRAQEYGTSGRTTSSLSGETDSTSLSHGRSSISLDSGAGSNETTGSNEFLDDAENLDTPDQIARLAAMFPNTDVSHIEYHLRKHKGNFLHTMDELLNQEFLVDEKAAVRGIDGFAKEDNSHRGRGSKKGKKNKKRFISTEDEDVIPSKSMATPANKWEIATADIQFIVSRTGLSEKTVSSVYHANGASKQKTILALIDQNVDEMDTHSDDWGLHTSSMELSNEFHPLTFLQAASLLRMTARSTSKAHELAKALLAQPSASSGTPDRIIPQYLPVKLTSDAPSPPSNLSPPSALLPISIGAGSAAALATQRSEQYAKASEYHRKGRSDPLMNAAAVVSAENGRAAHSLFQRTVAAEADALVARDATSTRVDLHGVSVKDATRIASERVRAWWHDRVEGRLRGDYTIITGVGLHSVDGKAKIGPAVGRMLMREGWVFVAGHGSITVTGVAGVAGKKKR